MFHLSSTSAPERLKTVWPWRMSLTRACSPWPTTRMCWVGQMRQVHYSYQVEDSHRGLDEEGGAIKCPKSANSDFGWIIVKHGSSGKQTSDLSITSEVLLFNFFFTEIQHYLIHSNLIHIYHIILYSSQTKLIFMCKLQMKIAKFSRGWLRKHCFHL